MSKTPRTDEAMFATAMNRTVVVHVKFAQQLETELADKEKQLAEEQAEIEHKNKIIEQMREALRLALPEARSTHVEQTILAALAAERGE